MQAPDLLSQLRDIHLPEEPSVWPLAPGWYVLGVFILASLFIIYRTTLKKVKRRQFLKNALDIIDDIKLQHQKSKDVPASCASLSTCFKKIAIRIYPDQNVESLYGDDWLDFLNKTGNTMKFKFGIGKSLISAPYQKEFDVDMGKLFKLSESWVKQVVKNV